MQVDGSYEVEVGSDAGVPGSKHGMAFGAGAYFARDARLDCLLLDGKEKGW